MRLSWKGDRILQKCAQSTSIINGDAIDRLTQIECNVLLDEFPTVMETRKAGSCYLAKLQVQMQFLPRSIKLGERGVFPWQKLTELWRKEAIPQEIKDASIINLYK